jgi:hypothetical protein
MKSRWFALLDWPLVLFPVSAAVLLILMIVVLQKVRAKRSALKVSA